MADVTLGSIQSPLPPLGSYVLFPPSFANVVDLLGATYLRTGSYVLVGDTSLAGTVWESQDGQIAAGLTGIDFRGARQSVTTGAGFYAAMTGSNFRLTEIVNGIQTIVVDSIAPPNGLTNYSGATWGFSIGSRRFVAGYENSNAQSSIFELIGTTLTARYDQPATATLQTSWGGVSTDGSVAIIITNNGSGILRTSDGGTTWASVTTPASDMTRAAAKSGLFAIGRSSVGTVLTSPTGLAGSWTSRNVPGSSGILDVMFTPAGTLIAIGSNGIIHRSTNDGVSWTQVFTRTNAAVMAYDVRNARIACAVSENGGPMLFSQDDGVNWTSVSSFIPSAFGTTVNQFNLVIRIETANVTTMSMNNARLLKGVVGSRTAVASLPGTAAQASNYFIRIK